MKKKWLSKFFSVVLSVMLVLSIIPAASVSAEYTGIYTYGYEDAYSIYGSKVELSTARAHSGDYSLKANTSGSWKLIQAPLFDGEACGSYHTLVVDFWMYIDSTFDLSKLTEPMRVYTFEGRWCGSYNTEKGATFNVDSDWLGHWNHVSVTFANNGNYKVPYLYIMQCAGFGGDVYIDDVTVTSVSMGTYANGYAQTLKDGYFDDANNDLIVPTVAGGTIPTPTRDGFTFEGWYTENTYQNQVATYSAGNNTYYAKWAAPLVGVYSYGYEDAYSVYSAKVARSQDVVHSGEYSLALNTDGGWNVIQAPLYDGDAAGQWHTLVVDFWLYLGSGFDLSKLTDSMKVYTYDGSTWCSAPASQVGAAFSVKPDGVGHWNHISVTFANNTTKMYPYLYIPSVDAGPGFGAKAYIDDVTVTSLSYGTYSGGAAKTLVDGYFDDANNDLIVPALTGGTIPVPTRSGYTFDGWYTESTLVNEVTAYSATVGTYYASWIYDGPTITKTYMNTFDNEAGTVDTATHSVEDFYSYYDIGLSIFNGEKVTRKTKYFGKAWNYCSGTAEPYIDLDALTDNDDSTVPGTYGKDSYGSMMLAYTSYPQQEDANGNGFYARFRVWDNQSTKTAFDPTNKPRQLIEASDSNTVYRISFDYKADVPAGYTGGIYYFNGSNTEYFKQDLGYNGLTELTRIKDTNGAWVNSGYSFAVSSAWSVASLALIMDDCAKSQGTRVWIDNLKIEVTDASAEQLVTVTFMDDGDYAFTVTGLPGMTYTPFAIEKDGYTLGGWLDYDDQPVTRFVIPQADETYYADWIRDGHSVAKTYMNTFENEAGTVDTATHSIEDVYSYYDMALSVFDGQKVTRKTKDFGKAYSYCSGTAEPWIDLDALTDHDDSTVPAMLGNNSYGSMMLSYPSNDCYGHKGYGQQVDGDGNGYYARFRVWDNTSTKEMFGETNKPKQLVQSSDNSTIFRVSFDYKADFPAEDYEGGIYYYNGYNTEYFKQDMTYTDLTELARVKDTGGAWLRSEYTYVTGRSWMIACIALIMDDNDKSVDAKVWIDNLKIEVMDTTDFDDLVTYTFMDGETQIKTVSGLFGLDTYVAAPEKWGYTFAGWVDENGNEATIPAYFEEDETYYATWNYRLMNVKGDLNADNDVNILDLIRLKKHIANDAVAVTDGNAFMNEYFGNAYRLTAMCQFLLGEDWAIEDYPMAYSQSDGTYRYVWGDEFNGKRLDRTKWRTGNLSTSTNANRVVQDSPDVISVADGELTLKSILYTDPSDSNVKYKMPEHLYTEETMNFKYGYMEMRAKIPLAIGATPSFWMKGCNSQSYSETLVQGNASYLTEIDIFERTEQATAIESGLNTRQIVPNLHKWFGGLDNTNHRAHQASMKYSFDKNDTGYHVYGFKWTSTQMIMSVDGVNYATFDITTNWDSSDQTDMSGFRDPAYLIIGNRIRTSADGTKSAISDADLPSDFTIDWIRLFQTDSGELYTAD